MTKKIIRNKDVVFLEGELNVDDKKMEKASYSIEFPIIPDAVHHPIMPVVHEREVQEVDGDTRNEDAPMVNDVELTKQVDKELPLPPVEVQLRRVCDD